MSLVTVWLALALPWLIGLLLVRVLWRALPWEPRLPPGRVLRRQQPRFQPGDTALLLGYGYLLGMLLATLLLRAQAALGLEAGIALPMVALALLGLALLHLDRRLTVPTDATAPGPRLPLWQRLLWWLLCAWLALRLGGLALELWWRPLSAWDAWTTWALRARVWSESGWLVPFLAPDAWLALTPGDPAYSLHAAHYPLTVSLLALWPALAHGAWSEPVAQLPWLGIALALGLAFYGQARRWGADPLTALVFLWLLWSLPLLGSHVAIAGYADLWLATALGGAFMALLLWARDGDPRQALLALLCALTLPLLKIEGWIWLTLILPAAVVARLPHHLLIVGTALLFALFAAVLLIPEWSSGLALTLPWLGELRLTPGVVELPVLGRFDLAYQGAWEPIARNLMRHGNWHLLMFLLTGALVGALLWYALRWWIAARTEPRRWWRAGLIFMLLSLLALFVLFFMTGAHRWAQQSTSINRVVLQFVPAWLFWLLTLWLWRPLARQPLRPAGTTPAAG